MFVARDGNGQTSTFRAFLKLNWNTAKMPSLAPRDAGTWDGCDCRYGADAGAASAEGLNAAGYATDAVWATSRIGVRTVAKAAAKKTAKGVIKKWTGQEGPLGPGSRGGSGSRTPPSADGRAGTPGVGGRVDAVRLEP